MTRSLKLSALASLVAYAGSAPALLWRRSSRRATRYPSVGHSLAMWPSSPVTGAAPSYRRLGRPSRR